MLHEGIRVGEVSDPRIKWILCICYEGRERERRCRDSLEAALEFWWDLIVRCTIRDVLRVNDVNHLSPNTYLGIFHNFWVEYSLLQEMFSTGEEFSMGVRGGRGLCLWQGDLKRDHRVLNVIFFVNSFFLLQVWV